MRRLSILELERISGVRGDRIEREEDGERILTDLEVLYLCRALRIDPELLIIIHPVLEEIEDLLDNPEVIRFLDSLDFGMKLDVEIPGWFETFCSPDFRQWLKTSKSPQGEPLLLILKEGFEDKDMVEVVKVFKAYEKSKKELSWSFRCLRSIEKEKRKIQVQKRNSDPLGFQIISRGASRESRVQCSLCKKPVPDNADPRKVLVCGTCVQILLTASKKSREGFANWLSTRNDPEALQSIEAFVCSLGKQ